MGMNSIELTKNQFIIILSHILTGLESVGLLRSLEADMKQAIVLFDDDWTGTHYRINVSTEDPDDES